MNLQLVYQYYELSLSKNENMFEKTNQLRKQKQNEKRKRKFPPAGIGPEH